MVTDDAADVDAVLNVMNKLADDVGKLKLILHIKPTMKNDKLSHQRFGPKSGPNQEFHIRYPASVGRQNQGDDN